MITKPYVPLAAASNPRARGTAAGRRPSFRCKFGAGALDVRPESGDSRQCSRGRHGSAKALFLHRCAVPVIAAKAFRPYSAGPFVPCKALAARMSDPEARFDRLSLVGAPT